MSTNVIASTFTPRRVAFLGGAIAWLSHFLGLYIIAEWGCRGALTGTFWWVTSVTILFAVISGYCTYLALKLSGTQAGILGTSLTSGEKNKLASNLIGEPTSELVATEKDFLANFGVISNAIFTLTIIVQAIPVFFFTRPCG